MLKVAVFGCGHLGKFHLNNWKEIKEATIVGFYDPDDRVALEVAHKFQIPRFEDVESLLDHCDIADIVAPTPIILSYAEKPSVRENMFLSKSHWPIPWRKPENCLNW
jgi:predicted dehydrogenase